MKKILVTTLALCSFASFASTPGELAEQEKENMKMLAQLGLPLPGSGIKVVPRSELHLTEEQMLQGAREDQEIRDKGYVSTYTNRPRELLTIEKNISKNHLLANQPLSNESTELRSSPKQIPLAFKYKGIEVNKGIAASGGVKLIAAAPKGAYHADQEGWSGVAQFFKEPSIGTCAYSVMNVKAANSAVLLAQEDVTYIINDKATLNHIEGSEDSGFIYLVKWYDPDNFHELECASMTYSNEKNQEVIELAKRIDSSNEN